MVSKSRAGSAASAGKPDSISYGTMFKETREAARKALQRHGEPQMTLEKLREALNEQLGDVSLGDWIEKEREAGL